MITEEFIDRLERELRNASQRKVKLVVARLPRPSATAASVIGAVVIAAAAASVLLQVGSRSAARHNYSPAGGLGSAPAALEQAATTAAAGTIAPPLSSGQLWYTTAISVGSTPTYRAAHANIPTGRLLAAKVEIQKWISYTNEQEVSVPLSAARGALRVGGGSGSSGIPSDAPGFGDWDPPSVADFPTTPAGVLGALAREPSGYLSPTPTTPINRAPPMDTNTGAFTRLAQIAALLGDEPLRPTARAAALRAVADLPGLRYLGSVRDPLGRAGIGVAERTAALRPLAVQGPQRYEFEMIFDPATGAVLGSRTILLKPPVGLRATAGEVLFSWAYISSRVVSTSSLNKVLAARAAAGAKLHAALRQLTKPGQPCHTGQRSRACQRVRTAALARLSAQLR